jgi:hypothetical protein
MRYFELRATITHPVTLQFSTIAHPVTHTAPNTVQIPQNTIFHLLRNAFENAFFTFKTADFCLKPSTLRTLSSFFLGAFHLTI